jgi:class 3 adenylate cyclase
MSVCSLCGTANPAVASFCMSCGNRLSAPVSRGDVRKSVTIVFCDVTGSTALAERLDPEAVRGVMSRYFDAMRAALERHGGTVEKFIGDAVMAVFGLPHAHEDDALRAVRAAADMRAEVRRLGDELRMELGVEFAARIGVNTGEVIAGDAAAGQAMVTGDAVNVAARLEQNAPPAEVLLGPATYRLVRNAVTAESAGPLQLKGKAEPLPAYRLVEVLSPVSEDRTQLGLTLVGRQEELEFLRAQVARATEALECRSVTILAPAGTGKSRLVEEFLQDLPAPTQWLKGRCLPYGDGITYFPVTQVVRQAAGLSDFDDPDKVEHAVRQILADEEHQDLVGDRILHLLGIGAAGSPEDTLWAVRRFVEAIARQRPLVLVIEDLHWAEPTLLDLIEHISECSQDVPLLLLGTARPELLDVRPAWARNSSRDQLLALEPLSGSQCHAMISQLLGGRPVPDSVAQRVAQAAGGTPLFVEELVAMMLDEGLLQRTGDGWTPMGDLAVLAAPPSISALLAARLDRLSDEERSVLDAGSVVGQEFLVGAVRELVTPQLRPAALHHLMAMVRKELLRPDRSTVAGEDAFRFRHELVRDAAYDALPKQVRADLHALVAAWMERVAGDRIAEHEEIIGYHLEQAHRYRTELSPHDPAAPDLALRAGRALAASGRRASARGDVRATANLLDRARRLLPSEDVERLELLPVLAEALDEIK